MRTLRNMRESRRRAVAAAVARSATNEMIGESTSGQRNSVGALAGPALRAAERSPFQLVPTGVGLTENTSGNAESTLSGREPKVEFCGQKHFFCGVAKKFGCQVCAGK